MERLPQQVSSTGGHPGGATAYDCEGELAEFRLRVAANDVRAAQLARAIEHEIIPRLMMAHRGDAATVDRDLPPAADDGDAPPSSVDRAIADSDVKHFTSLVLSAQEDVAFPAVQALRDRGVSVESIYLDLLAPAARHLGYLWEEDLCSFTDVTVGLGRLQRVLRELSPALGHGVAHPAQGRRVLLLPGPGEQHTFGLVMVAEFFRREGWDVAGGAWAADADAATLVGAEWFDVVGFSLGAAVWLPALTAKIAAVRHSSRNRALTVLVGGPLFGLDPAYWAEVGADGMTIDGSEAPALAERLIAQQMPSRPAPG